jgi:hypothetical protein
VLTQEECAQAGLPEFAAEVARDWAAITDASGMRGSEERELEEAAAAGLAACLEWPVHCSSEVLSSAGAVAAEFAEPEVRLLHAMPK